MAENTASTIATTTSTTTKRRTTSTRRMPLGHRRFTSLSTLFLLVSILLLGERALFDLAQCEPALQQRGQSQAQQQSNELTGRQDSSQFSSGGGDGANLGEGLAAIGANYRRGPYTNTKRARKMSAFMPMRGRKDGRDLVGSDSLRDFHPVGSRYLASSAPTDSSGVGSGASLAQSATSLLDQQLAQIRESEPSDVSLVRLFNGQAAIPPQFYSQVQARGATSGQSIKVTRSGQASNGLPTSETGVENSNQIMQAKLRRAFHPMRGKKVPRIAWTPTQLEELLSGLDQFSVSLSADDF